MPRFVLPLGLITSLFATSAVALATPAGAATTNPLPNAGLRKNATRVPFSLSDATNLSVDVGTANTLLTQRLFTLPGIKGDLPIGLAWNSSAVGSTVPSAVDGKTGSGWAITGFDQRLTHNADGSVTYVGPNGLTGVFAPVTGSTTAYVSPVQFQGDLTRNAGGWNYRDHASQATLAFNTSGRLTAIADRNSNQTQFTYSGSAPASIVSTRGSSPTRTLTFTMSGSHLAKITQTAGSSTRSVSFGYSPNGYLHTVTDATGKVTTYATDAGSGDSALVGYITNPNGAATSITYSNGKAIAVAQPNGAAGAAGISTTRFSYSATTELVADPTTDQTLAVASVPHTTYTLYNATSGLIKQVTDPDGHARSRTYSPLNSIASSSPASGGATTYAYQANAGESLTGASTAAGASGSATYTNSGASQYLPSSATNDAGSAIKYTYNGTGNQLSSAQGSGPTANVTYNADGTVATSATRGAAAGVKTSYTYDPATHNLTNITPVTGSSLGARQYTWDDFGRLATATDGRGNRITYSYDNLDRITRVAYSDANTPAIGYVYDSAGRVTQRNDGADVTNYGWDPLGHLLSIHTSTGGSDISYTWDKAGALASQTDNRGTTSYGYDAAHQLTSMTYPAPRQGPDATQTLRFANDANGRRTDAWLDADAAHTTWSAHNHTIYDSSGRVSRVYSQTGPASAAKTILDRTYCYVAGSTPTGGCTASTTADRTKIQWMKDALSGESTTYTYDGKTGGSTDAVTKVVVSGGANPRTYAYAYDAAGNRTTASVTGSNPVSQSLTSNAGNQISTAGYSYDAAGNLTADNGTSGAQYSYNAAGQLVTSRKGAGPVTTYKYAGANQDELLKQATDQGDTFTYAYGRNDQNGLPEVEQASYTTAGRTYSAWVTHDPSGAPVALEGSTGVEALYVYDGTGNPVGLASDDTSLSYMYAIDPYGSATETQSSGADDESNPYLFEGGLQARATGLVKFGARWYSPVLGRWTQQDALNAPLDPHNANRYQYAGGDPVNQADPSGVWTFDVSGQACAFGGCLGVSVGFDDDGDVNLGGSVGVGGGGGVGASFDPAGDYTDGGDVSATASCNAGPLQSSIDLGTGATSTSIGTSEGFGCSASVGGSYTF